MSKAFRLVNALLAAETLTAKEAAAALGLKVVANARPYMKRAAEIEGVELLENPLRIRLQHVRQRSPSDDIAIAACFGASLATVFEGSRYESGMRDAVAYVAAASPDPTKFADLNRKFFFVRRGGEWALPDKSSLLDLLVRAVLRNRRVWIAYKNFQGKVSKGVVEPLSLAVYDHQLYVVVRRTADTERRLYRFSRITDLKLRDEFEYPPRGKYEPSAVFADTFGIVIGEERKPEKIRIRLTASWSTHAQTHRWHPSQRVDESADGVVVQIEVRGCHEVVAWALSFGEDAEVLEPAWLRERVAATARRMAVKYDGAGTDDSSSAPPEPLPVRLRKPRRR